LSSTGLASWVFGLTFMASSRRDLFCEQQYTQTRSIAQFD
jgi:hypothetical protein